MISVGFSSPNISFLEGTGSVSVCINKSTEVVFPITVSVASQPLTANSGAGLYLYQVYLLVIPFMMSCLDDRLHLFSKSK